MDNVHIYLSGGMSNLSLEEQTKWRKQIRDAILWENHDLYYKPIFFDPTTRYGFDVKVHKSEMEAFEYDLNALRKSDLVVVNFNDPQSIGTAMEIAIAKDRMIPVIGLNKDNAKLNPWLECCCTRICDDMRELVTLIVEFYLK